jgi:hypothetical protein
VGNPFGYIPQRNAPDPVQAEDLRRLAIRYLHHPDAQVGTVSMGAGQAGAAGRFKVVITLESNVIF